ncbi:MAG: hypothetical protein AAF206_17805 [Bacteroidota bacterium]
MRSLLLFLAIVSGLSTFAQSGTEIYLFDLIVSDDGVSITNGRNITNRPGYDNQAYFHHHLPVIYYASIDESERSDIKSFNYQTGETKRFTQTSEREYSPTLTPDNDFISCIIQRDNGAQDLGKYPITGGKAEVLIDDLTVGYHSWVDENRLLMFVLGEPHELHLFDIPAAEDQIIHKNIGRSLHRIPGQRAMSFVDKSDSTQWKLIRLDMQTFDKRIIADLPAGREDVCWTQDGQLLLSQADHLLFYQPGSTKGWEKVRVEGKSGMLKGITRIAVNPVNDKITVVVSEEGD